jgi:hypothetical protein
MLAAPRAATTSAGAAAARAERLRALKQRGERSGPSVAPTSHSRARGTIRLDVRRSFRPPVGPSGSGAPSDLSIRRASYRVPGGDPTRRCALHRRRLELRLSALPRRRPRRPHPEVVPTGRRSGLADLPAPEFRVGPCGLSRTSRPDPSSPLGAFRTPPGLLASVTSTAWSDAECTGASRSGQLDVSAGHTANMQVKAAGESVTKRTAGAARQRDARAASASA